jgi:hypothetical protein
MPQPFNAEARESQGHIFLLSLPAAALKANRKISRKEALCALAPLREAKKHCFMPRCSATLNESSLAV